VLGAAGALVLALAAAGCGSGGSSGSANAASGASGGSSNGNEPLTVGLLMSVKGEDSYALDDYYQGAKLAVQQINKAGGFHGQPVKTFRVKGPQDPTKLGSALLDAAGKKPDIIIGAASPALGAISRQVDSVGIPILGPSSYDVSNGHVAGSKWVFQALPSDPDTIKAAAKYAVKGLGAKKVAVLHTNESFGTKGSKKLKKDIPAAGGSIVTDQSYAPDATDMSGPLLAAKGADAIVNWSYPTPQVAAINAMAHKGDSTPTVGNAGIDASVDNGAITKGALQHIYSTVPCNPQGERPKIQKFVKAVKAKYDTNPSFNTAVTYDLVHLAVQAAKTSKSLEPDDLLASLDKLDYSGGVCAADYKADKQHTLVHDVTILGFKKDRTPVTKKVYHFTPASR
jgi:ABC-type branched-subunit amino acid transport system substrate-binding protein